MQEPFGSYLLLNRINQGGMAEVYLAQAFGIDGTDRIVALKCIRPELSQNPAFVKMFVHEAKLSVLLNHENIVPIFALGQTESNYYIAMEYVAGKDLRAVATRMSKRGLTLPIHLALHMVGEILEGLDHAHHQTDHLGQPLSIVHRDVSPHNVLIGYSGEIKLIDFGVAKAASKAPGDSGVLKGKYGYMSPEHVKGRSVDVRSDIFAAGILLWELITGKRLFDGSSDFSILEKVRYAEIFPPTVLVPELPPDLEAIVLRALSLDPGERFRTAAQMHQAIIEVVLQHYYPATARMVGHLMHDLFMKEIESDRQHIANAKTAATTGAANDHGSRILVPWDPTGSQTKMSRTILDRPEPVIVNKPKQQHSAMGPVKKFDDLSVNTPVLLSSDPTEPKDQNELGSIMASRKYGLLRNWRELATLFVAMLIALGLMIGTWQSTQRKQHRQGRLTIVSVPKGADIIIDGIHRGRTPHTIVDLQTGHHDLVIEQIGYLKSTRTLNAGDGENLTINVILKAKRRHSP